jgi:uncharacterized repeat protein (TIGR01451 family)
LLLPGDGFAAGDTVVYSALANTTQPLVRPSTIPGSSSDSLGVADLVTAVNAPYSLTVRLPDAMKADQSYALWVVSSTGEWSNGIKINDARPLWITPDEAYESAPADSAQIMKVVGRNLQPAPGASTQVRLIGPHAQYTLTAAASGAPSPPIDRYVAKVQLPAHMEAGRYSVQVSRDGVSWVPLLGQGSKATQSLTVLSNPPAATRFPVGSFTFGACDAASPCTALRGHCDPSADDDHDDTRCVTAAIAAAQAAGGGAVVFGPGTWNLSNPGRWSPGKNLSDKGVSQDGIVVPEGVGLQGAGIGTTHLIRGANWDLNVPTFMLAGRNSVRGFTFSDARVYQKSDWGSAFLTLGRRWDRARSDSRGTPTTTIGHVTITQNEFDKPFQAIGNGGLAIDHLTVTDNIFGAFHTALYWEGVPSNLAFRYRFTDSVVNHNRFYPGSYLDASISQGTIATGLSGAYRVDFSDNTADGASTKYLYHPESDPKGWRAAYFWWMHDNVEMLLLSENSATCTGDKVGDGEAFSFDSNHNRTGFASLTVPVVATSSDVATGTSTITVQGALIDSQLSYGRAIPVGSVSSYYVDDWLQVVQGPGLGQSRKVVAISTGSNASGPTVTLTVAPAYDVLPRNGSLVMDSRLYWQTYTVGNVIDQRTPLCLKSNRTRRAGGLITLYGSTTDSVVEGNAQYDTSGILLSHQFELADPAAQIPFPSASPQNFNEIRGNLISGTYDEQDRTPPALYGIALAYAATPNTAPPPIIGYGVAISHNTISRATGPKGAISLAPGWYTGPESRALPGTTPWKIANTTLLFKNTLTELGHPGMRRVGIGISANSQTAPIEWRSVLYKNSCSGTTVPALGFVDFGAQSVRYCPTAVPDSCECLRQPTDLGVSAAGEPVNVPLGGTVRYTVTVANNGTAAATGVMLSMEPSAGTAITSATGTGIACDITDPNINLCRLGSIDPGVRKTVAVTATIATLGPAQTVFSVTHAEADSNVSNDGITLATVADPAAAKSAQ